MVGVTQLLFGYFGKLVNFVANTYSKNLIILTSQKICRTFRDYLNQHLVQDIQQMLYQTTAIDFAENNYKCKILFLGDRTASLLRVCRKWPVARAAGTYG
jgi:hypothetical protein